MPSAYVWGFRSFFPRRNLRKGASLMRSEEHTSELQSQSNLVCRLLLEKKKKEQYGRHHVGLVVQPEHVAYKAAVLIEPGGEVVNATAQEDASVSPCEGWLRG